MIPKELYPLSRFSSNITQEPSDSEIVNPNVTVKTIPNNKSSLSRKFGCTSICQKPLLTSIVENILVPAKESSASLAKGN